MKNISEIREIPYVNAVVLFSPQWEAIAWSFDTSFQQEPYFEKLIAFLANPVLLSRFFGSFGTTGEAEFVYQDGRVLFRRAGKNLLTVLMGKRATAEIVRLAVDMLLPQISRDIKVKYNAALVRDMLFKKMAPKVKEEVERFFLDIKN